MYCTNCGKDNPDNNKFCLQCGQPLGVEAPGGVTPPTPSGTQRASSSRLWLGLLGLLVVAGIIAAAVFFVVPALQAPGPEMVVGFPNRDNEVDLKLLRVGQDEQEAQDLADNAIDPNQFTYNASLWYTDAQNRERPNRSVGSGFGGFLPNSDRLIIYYLDGEDVRVLDTAIGAEEVVETISTDALPLSLNYLPQLDSLFLSETRDDNSRCYIAPSGEKATRLGKADSCYVDRGGNTVLMTERNSDNEFTLSTMDLDGANEVTLLDDIEGVTSFRTSIDFSHIAYHQRTTDDGAEITLIDRMTGDTLLTTGEYVAIVDYAFLGDSNVLFYVAENEDGELELRTSQAADPIATTATLGVPWLSQDPWLIYVTGDEDGENGVYSHNQETGETGEVMVADGLRLAVLSDPARILIREASDNELIIHSTNIAGGEMIDLYSEDDVTLTTAYQPADMPMLYFLLQDDSGDEHLFVTPPDQETGFNLIEGWYNIEPLTLSGDGSQLIFKGQEDSGDDWVLYAIAVADGASEIKLDDSGEDYRNAVFDPSGDSVIYTAVEGENVDDVAIYQTPLDGEERPTKLYDEAFISDVRWAALNPFSAGNLFWTGNTLEGTSYCPGVRVIAPGDTLSRTLQDPFEGDCLRFNARADEPYTFKLTSPDDERFVFALTIYDRFGTQMTYYNGSFTGRDPRLVFTTPDSGSYFIKVTGSGAETEPVYELEFNEGIGEAALDGATVLDLRDSVTSVTDNITADDEFLLETLNTSGYGDFYAFAGSEGDTVVIDVLIGPGGSELDPFVTLLSPSLEIVRQDDDGGQGLNSRIETVLPSSGRFYIMVTARSGEFGVGNEYAYRLDLARR
jgi:hypothetical protein